MRATGAARDKVGGQNRKNVYLSLYVEEPLNSEVIKSFVPELRSRYVFFVFRDSYVLCTYVMNISVSGYGTMKMKTNFVFFMFFLNELDFPANKSACFYAYLYICLGVYIGVCIYSCVCMYKFLFI